MSGEIRVLLVEDHRMFADAIALLLAGEEDIEPMGVSATGEDLLEVARQACPDVVLMDVDLPGMDGIQATRELHEICPDTQVVVITALRRPDLIAEAVEAGACGFVPKTQAADELLDVVREAAQGEMVLPGGDTRGLLEDLMAARSARMEAAVLMDVLTERELEILQGFADGMNAKELARALFISQHTVHSHTRSILTKLGVRSKLDAVLRGLRLGMIRLS